MFSLLQHVLTLQAPTETGTTVQLSTSYATTEATILGRINPVKTKAIVTATGQLPVELYEFTIGKPVTIDIGYRILYNGGTYEVQTLEDWEWHVSGICQKIHVEEA